jgi:phospholipid/cholesterol/gamma-HCH transport system permease protein
LPHVASKSRKASFRSSLKSAPNERTGARAIKAIEDVGRGATGVLEYAGGLAILSAESAGFIARLRVRVKETFAQAYFLGIQSTVIVLLTSTLTGMIVSFEAAQNAVSYGISNVVGGAVAFTTSRELGPMLSAVVVAGRAGAAIAAELGSMVVTEQIEALESLGLSPIRMLVVPRLVAMIVMMPVLTILADIVAIAGGGYLAHTLAGIPYDTFTESIRNYGNFSDFWKGLIKAAVFGALIVLVGCYQGLSTRGGAAGVGRSTTGAVVLAIILIFVTNFMMSLILFR